MFLQKNVNEKIFKKIYQSSVKINSVKNMSEKKNFPVKRHVKI